MSRVMQSGFQSIDSESVPDTREALGDAFRQGMRSLAAGVTLVTTLAADGPHGFVATAVTSLSVEPKPSLLVCVNRESATRAHILEAGSFAVNLLSTDHVGLARRFTDGPREHRFADRHWMRLPSGAPALSDSLAVFDCRVMSASDVHSHTILIGEVDTVRLGGKAHDPLLYFDGEYRTIDGA